MSASERIDIIEFLVERDAGSGDGVHPREPEHPFGFVFDDYHGTVDVWWGGYEYSIVVERIASPMQLLHWVAHMSKKSWRNQTSRRISRFVECICERKGWPLWLSESAS